MPTSLRDQVDIYDDIVWILIRVLLLVLYDKYVFIIVVGQLILETLGEAICKLMIGGVLYVYLIMFLCGEW